MMSANLEQAILKKIQALPANKQQEVLALVDEMLKEEREPRPRESRPIWEIIEEISSQAPPGTWDDVPTDGSLNHDHYLYGTPKKNARSPSLPRWEHTLNPTHLNLESSWYIITLGPCYHLPGSSVVY